MRLMPSGLLPSSSSPAAHPLGPLHLPPALAAVRRQGAALRRGLARSLLRAARRVRERAAPPRRPPELEFYAEAGAPEGALYLDGQLVAYLPVERL